MSKGRHVAIIGAGAVGVISAIEALREGHRVTLIDAGEPGGEQAASYGNAGWLSSHSVIPPAEPGVWKKVPFFLMDPLGPLAIRWSYLPKALPWLIRYLLSGWTEARVEKTAFALRDLLKDAPLLHRKLAEEAGVPELVERNGVMHVFPSRGNFDNDLGWRLRRKVGVEWMELNADEIRQREPDLHPRYTFGVVVEEAGRCRDPGAYVAALAQHALASGAQLVRAKATGLKLSGNKLVAVITETGEIPCDAAVIAAGAHSKRLTASIGDPLPAGDRAWLSRHDRESGIGPAQLDDGIGCEDGSELDRQGFARRRHGRDRRPRGRTELEARRDPARQPPRHVPETADGHSVFPYQDLVWPSAEHAGRTSLHRLRARLARHRLCLRPRPYRPGRFGPHRPSRRPASERQAAGDSARTVRT
ncbi:glycine/D-amino acid oxidase-like deaminating enzyme [Bradyrhizobium sp. LB7.2]